MMSPPFGRKGDAVGHRPCRPLQTPCAPRNPLIPKPILWSPVKLRILGQRPTPTGAAADSRPARPPAEPRRSADYLQWSSNKEVSVFWAGNIANPRVRFERPPARHSGHSVGETQRQKGRPGGRPSILCAGAKPAGDRPTPPMASAAPGLRPERQPAWRPISRVRPGSARRASWRLRGAGSSWRRCLPGSGGRR